MMTKNNRAASSRRGGYTLLEVTAVVVLLGILAAIAVQRFSTTMSTGKKNSCYVNKGDIEMQVQLWYRNKGAWPATSLSDVSADGNYFPSGLPTCPVDGTAYTIDATTHKITGHTH